MSAITREEIEKQIKELYYESGNLVGLMRDIDSDLRREDSEYYNKHIYSMRGRLKSADSIFLKLKRKEKEDILDLPDLLGLRAYCLYDEDVILAHKKIIQYLFNKNKLFLPLEINIYSSWGPERIQEFLRIIKSNIPKELQPGPGRADTSESKNTLEIIAYNHNNTRKQLKINVTGKASGYKSIHYLFSPTTREKLNSVLCELQLRTIIQDVWAEIEHNISYKKANIHPHVKKLFNNLSNFLENAENQISTIREIQSKDHLLHDLSKTTPIYLYLHYDDRIKVEHHFEQQGLLDEYINYKNTINSENVKNKSREAIANAESMLSSLKQRMSQNITLDYFFDMELAYISILRNKRQDALNIYKKHLHSADQLMRYAIYFRKGEIEYLNERYEDSFDSFDKCERIIESIKNEAHPINLFNVYQRLANIYWSLGEEYIDIALKKQHIAFDIFKRHNDLFDNNDVAKSSLYNNLCWYHLVKCNKYYDSFDHKTESKDAFTENLQQAEFFYNLIINLPFKQQNTTHTAAWFCYTKFLSVEKLNSDYFSQPSEESVISEKKKWLEDAIEWCKETLENKDNYGLIPVKSRELQMDHIQTILQEAKTFEQSGY
ncbi:RelA/SpoT domain-containing protein [Methylomonas sp. UP202]|uniref:RelA/SpoT domain-containing protein n=1 Tax=Methylomonas sp. UP202 TaxID=3040943 RepID=UPI00247879A0|nr:RelA/SpoT domain-containing protein [Methylomonas sp. UP202]WGS84659.1 RelA/SpoT domain-containing protein [Methylomonas sp. UP202]